jgi:uncharacterized membrane protein
MSWARRLQLAGLAMAIIAYSLLSHYGASHVQAHGLATFLAVLPIGALGVLLALRSLGTAAALATTLLLGGLLWQCWPQLNEAYALLYLLQQLGFYGLLMASFALTLTRGRTPLCTTLADRVHGPLSEAERRYTRQVTAAWALFFLFNLLVTLVLFEFAPLNVWSAFGNFVAPLLIALMFAGEYAVRRRVLPAVQSGGLMATLRVYFASPR